MNTFRVTAWTAAFGVVFGLLAAGIILLVSSPPRGEPIQLSPPPTPPPLVVHVSGAVERPGLCQLAPDSRVQDAIQAAGGLASKADVGALNLAARVQDGDLIRVPFLQQDQEVSAEHSLAKPKSNSGGVQASGGTEGLININTANLEELETLPGIGPVTAQKIIDFREAQGPFPSLEAIQDVSGIGPATFDKIKSLISIGH